MRRSAGNDTLFMSLRGTIVPKQALRGMRLPRFARNDKKGRAGSDKKVRGS
jgi:hypothetical protein